MALKKVTRVLVGLFFTGVIVALFVGATVLQERTGQPIVGYMLLAPVAISIPWGLAHVVQGARVKRTEADTVVDATGDAGWVALEGEATSAGETLTAPMSGEECLAYSYKYESRQRNPRAAVWNTMKTGGEAVDFLLEDETGAVQVAAGDESVSLVVQDDESQYRASRGLPDRVEAFIESEGLGRHGGDQRYTEYRLHAGETAYVAGTPTDRYSSDATIHEEASAVVGPETGALAAVKRYLPGSGFTVADAPIEGAGEEIAGRGWKVVVLSVLWAATIWFFTLRGNLPV